MVPVPTRPSTYSVGRPKQTTNSKPHSEQQVSDPDVLSSDPNSQQSEQTQPASAPEQRLDTPGSTHSTTAVPGINDPQLSFSGSTVSIASAAAVMVSGTRIVLDVWSHSGGTPVDPPTAIPSINPVTYSPVTTKKSETVQLQSDRRPVPGLNLIPGAPFVPVSGITTSFRLSALPSNAESVPLAPQSPDILVTTVADQSVTASPTAVDVAGSTALTTEAPAMTINGTLPSLNSAGGLIVGGSRSVALGSKSAGLGGVVITGSPVSGAPFASTSSMAAKGNLSRATGEGTGHEVKLFAGNAESMEGSSHWKWLLC